MKHDPQLTLPGVVEPEQTTRIEFTIPHEPVPWPRAGHRIMWPKAQKFTPSYMLKTVAALQAELDRLRRAFNEIRKKAFVMTYTPKGPNETFKAAAQACAKAAYWGEPLDCPLSLTAIYVFPRPATAFWKTKFMPRFIKSTKPDNDNCTKILKDSLEGIIYVNDSRVAIEHVEKWYASGYEQPHVEVLIETLPQG